MKNHVLRRLAALLLALALSAALAVPGAAAGNDIANLTVDVSFANPEEVTDDDGNTVATVNAVSAGETKTGEIEVEVTGTPADAELVYVWDSDTYVSVTGEESPFDVRGNTPGTTSLKVTVYAYKAGESHTGPNIVGIGVGSISVTVKPVSVRYIYLSSPTMTITVGEDIPDLTATVAPTGANPRVVWESSAPSVLAVQERGTNNERAVLTLMSNVRTTTTVTITAKSQENHDIYGSCIVTVIPRNSGGSSSGGDSDTLAIITNEGDKLVVERGESIPLNLTGTLVSGSYTVEWPDTVKNEEGTTIAIVNKVGGTTLEGRMAGTGTLTVTLTKDGQTYTAECVVEVKSTASITLSPQSMRFDAGTKPQTVSIVSADENLSIQSFTYDENIIEVEPDPENERSLIVTQKAPGQTELRVTASNGAAATCTVVVSGVRLTSGETGPDIDPEEALEEDEVYIGKTLTLNYLTFGAAQGGGTAVWESNDNSVAYVALGRVVGRSEGKVRITVTIGDYVSQECEITVTESPEGVTEARAKSNVPLALSTLLSDLYNKCREVTGTPEQGGTLSYITNLQVSPDQGVLYYGYGSAANTGAGVSAAERYYYSNAPSGSREIKGLTFVPTAGFSGTATITFTGWTTDRESYSGSIRLTVAEMDDVSYATRQDEPISFQAGDFNAVCRARTGRELSYVTFTLPNEARGTLYYDYSSQSLYPQAVTASTQYKRTSSPYLEEVTFVPAEGYHGTVSIAYRAVDTAGTAYTGTVTITVTGESDAEDGVVTYKLTNGSQVSFQVSDFNKVCREATDEDLNYIQFTSLPLYRQGALYYNYRGDGSRRVSLGSRYYRTGQPSVDNVSFVAASTMTGKASMTYVGYSTSGKSFTGIVYVELEEATDLPATIRYSVRSGKAVTLQAADFNSACVTATGNTLDYVRFQLPSSSQGVLCYRYDNVQGTYASQVQTSTNYYRSGGSAQVGSVSFLADKDYVGPVSISYTGYDKEGKDYTGTLYITVSAPVASEVNYSGRTDSVIQISGSDIYRACASSFSQGQALSYIQFTSLPDAIGGRLYSGYSGYGTGEAVRIGDKYYYSDSPSIDRLSFVPRGRFQDVAVIDYTAYSASGEQVKGQINITISAATTSQYFSDMGNYTWAISSVDYMYRNKVVYGIGSERFGPGMNIQRCDFVVMLCRALGFTSSKTTSFSDVPANSYYATAVAAAKDLGIVNGNNGRFMPTSPLTRQDAMVMLYNALRAAGQTPEAGSSSDLAPFSDRGEVSSYARDAVYSLVRLGAVNGDGEGHLRPRSSITRAEMAVVLHYIMTM